MDSHGDKESSEAVQLAILTSHLRDAIEGLTKIGKHLPAAYAQMAFDILTRNASESDQSEFD